MKYKRCKKCKSNLLKIEEKYTPLTGAFSTVKGFKYETFVVCTQCGYRKKIKRHTLFERVMMKVMIILFFLILFAELYFYLFQ